MWKKDHNSDSEFWEFFQKVIFYDVKKFNPYLIETPFNAFANRADRANPDQAALPRAAWAAWSESTLFANGNRI